MLEFILNNQEIQTDLPTGTTVLDFVRYDQNLKGTKIGCREGDCGACIILVGELKGDSVSYRSMTSCLMPLANAAGKHIVTIEGINPDDGSLSPVQQAMVDESGTQCGFCTVGFVVSLTGFCVDETAKTPEMAVSSVDGNICRCTGYKSIERAAERLSRQLAVGGWQNDQSTVAGGSQHAPPYEGGVDAALGGRGGSLRSAIDKLMVPEYFDHISSRLQTLRESKPGDSSLPDRPLTQAVLTFVGGGTDVYVQKPDELSETSARHLFYNETLRGISDNAAFIEIGASATVTDLLVSPVMQNIFPDLYKHLKLVSSTPIRNMATLAGNFVNASPIGDMTVWFLALNADVTFDNGREMPLRKLYLDYKRLAKTDHEFIKTIRFRKPGADFYFNFEKVCKRTYLDIATVNTAISLRVESTPGPGWIPPALSEPGAVAIGFPEMRNAERGMRGGPDASESVPPAVAGGALNMRAVEHIITEAHIAAGGVAPIPLYLTETSAFLKGKAVSEETIRQANEIIQFEISPISDVRGSAEYKRLLLRQLFTAHFVELFDK